MTITEVAADAPTFTLDLEPDRTHAMVNGELWERIGSSSRIVYASPCGRWVLKYDTESSSQRPDDPDYQGSNFRRQSWIEATAWKLLSETPEAEWFLPVVGTGVYTDQYGEHHSWCIQVRSYATPTGSMNSGKSSWERQYDNLPPQEVAEAHQRGWELLRQALGIKASDGQSQYDAEFRIYDYGL